MRRIFSALALAAGVLAAAEATAQDHSRLYAKSAVSADAARLEKAIRNIYTIGLEPVMTPEETAIVAQATLDFPMPQQGDFALDFYVYEEGGRSVVTMPLLSLKTLEDATTAYAWLNTQRRNLGAIDLYFTMLRRTDPSGFPEGRYPPLLASLGVPEDAWKHPPVDDLSLRLRNEAYAFILGHEFGHMVLGHGSYADVTPEQSRDEEAAADAFALELLGRTGTPALGGLLLLQAQAYSLPNRGQFDSDAAWLAFLKERAYHPVTTSRIRALADYTDGPLIRSRPTEAAIWRDIAADIRKVAAILEDEDLQECVVRASEVATVADVAPRDGTARDLFYEACR